MFNICALLPKQRRWRVAAVLLVLSGVIGAVPALRWRSALVVLEAAGQLDGISWADLPYVLRPDSGIRLSHLVRVRNPYRVILNPLDTPADRARGREVFADRCARCHGDAAQGGAGPALVGRALAHGDSDWAMYRTVRYGVAGTAMAPVPLPREDIWRVIAFLHDRSYRQLPAPGASAALDRAPPVVPVTPAMLLSAGRDLDDWLLPFGSYQSRRFSADTQIDAANVAHLAVRWIHEFGTVDQRIESVPIVVGGRLYVTLPQGKVLALNAGTGATIWEFSHPLPADLRLCCIAANRGVAVLGERVFVGTLDAHLLALDAASGSLLWDRVVAPYQDGYSITSAPMPIGGTIVTGIAGGDFPTRGFVSSYDAATGALRWRTYTTPVRGEPGYDSWGRADIARPGGAATWGVGAYDPELGLLYWGTGNPAPDFNAAGRPGDNLYSCSLLALDAASGHLAWHFQFSPGDDHDWDASQTPALIDAPPGAAPSRLLAVANRNGFYYVLDRQTGKFVRGAAYIKQTWARGLTASGRPIPMPGTHPTPGGVFLYPSDNGGTNWWMAAYSPLTQLSYVDVQERGGIYFSTPEPPSPGKGKLFAGSLSRYVEGDPYYYGAVRAIDPATARVRWEHRNGGFSDWPRGGLLATAGGLVFGSDTSTLFALDAASGAVLWSFDTGSHISAPPISYRSQGRQYIAVAAGQMLLTFALPVR